MELSNYIEHTLLKPDATKEELERLYEEAKKYKFKGVCINPANVKQAAEYLKDSDIKIVTVVGFPLGANLSEVKVFETQKALDDGADEIDMVINIGELKNRNYDYVLSDIQKVKRMCGEKILKVIIETDLLTKEEIIKACELSAKAGADFVKTSTGFVKNGIGATAENVELMYKTVSPQGLQVKASAGIRDKEKALSLIKAGATRLGTSSGTAIVENR